MTSDVATINKIIAGQVKFELSKRGLKEPIQYMYLYARKPIGKVVAKIKIDKQYFENPVAFYALHQSELGYTKTEFENLYSQYENLHFYHISECVEFKEGLTLDQLNKKAAPQSIQYVDVNI